MSEQQAHAQPIQVSEYLVELLRDTFENWQSEFLQLLWQVGGLAILLYVGSPHSKEGDDRMEAKLDEILRRVDPQNGKASSGASITTAAIGTPMPATATAAEGR